MTGARPLDLVDQFPLAERQRLQEKPFVVSDDVL